MEKRKIYLLPTLVILLGAFFVGTNVFVSAQENNTETNDPTLDILDIDSPFGTLADEENAYRKVFDYKLQTQEDYKALKEDYENVKKVYEVAYGPRKEELEEQLTARMKDILITKLGAFDTFLTNDIKELEELNLVDPDQRAQLKTISSNFQSFADETQKSIDSAENLNNVEAFIPIVNTRISQDYNSVLYYIAKLSLHRGEYLRVQLVKHANLIQAHINASAELGGAVENLQKDFDSIMLRLEKSKNEYAEQKVDLAQISPLTSSPNDSNTVKVFRDVKSTSEVVVKAQSDLGEVISDLRSLYGQSPWDFEQLEI